MTTKEERIVERIEGASGGKGILRKEVLIDKEQMGEHCGLFGEVTLEPGAVLDIMSIMERLRHIISFPETGCM